MTDVGVADVLRELLDLVSQQAQQIATLQESKRKHEKNANEMAERFEAQVATLTQENARINKELSGYLQAEEPGGEIDALRERAEAAEAEILTLRSALEQAQKEHEAEQVLLATLAGEPVLMARGYSVVTLARLIAERAAAAEAEVHELRAYADNKDAELRRAYLLAGDLAAAEALHQRLSAALQTYGQHKLTCGKVFAKMGIEPLINPDRECTCGFDAALTGEQK